MDTCKALLAKINALQPGGNEELQAANEGELKRLMKEYDGFCALANQFVVTLDSTVTMTAKGRDLALRITNDISLKLTFNAAHTGVNPLTAVFSDPRGRAEAMLTAGSDVGSFDKKSGRLILPASLRLDFKDGPFSKSSLVLSTDGSNELGRGSRMDGNGNVRLVGSGTFERGGQASNACNLVIAGTVNPVP